MVTMTIPSSEELVERLKEIAADQGLTIEALVESLLEEYVSQHVSRRHDPIVGLFDSGNPDLVARHEDILRDEWHPD
jgi:predicted transcriptional regulator